MRYDSVREDPYASPFAAVPPPACLNDGYRKGRGKGKGHDGGNHGRGHDGGSYGAHHDVASEVHRAPLPDGLLISNVPAELNTLDALNRHFRKFGEVLKITLDVSEGRAFVQFADRIAAETAVTVPALDRPDIVLTWVPRSQGKGKAASRNSSTDCTFEHRVLLADPDEQRRVDLERRKREEISSRRTTLLAKLTEQMKTIMPKLNADGVPEAQRAAYRDLVLQIKNKMNSLGGLGQAGGVDDGGHGHAATGSGHAQAGASGKRDATWHALDLRPKVLRMNLMQGWTLERLREELRKYGVTDEQVRDLQLDTDEAGQPGAVEAALVQFSSRHAAEQLFNQRGELPFYAEWCNRPLRPPPVVVASTQPLPSLPGSLPKAEPLPSRESGEEAGGAGDHAAAGDAGAAAEQQAAGAGDHIAAAAGADAAAVQQAAGAGDHIAAAAGAGAAAGQQAAGVGDHLAAAGAGAAAGQQEQPRQNDEPRRAVEAADADADAAWAVDLSDEDDGVGQ